MQTRLGVLQQRGTALTQKASWAQCGVYEEEMQPPPLLGLYPILKSRTTAKHPNQPSCLPKGSGGKEIE